MIAAILLAVTVTVRDGNWGDASVADIQALLRNVQQNFFAAFPEPPNGDVTVVHGSESPLIAYRKSTNDSFRVYLDVTDRHWAQFSYQFAHEICHLACGHDRFRLPGEKKHPWMWLQESLCETASLFTLRRMSETWKTNPPYRNWKDYAPHLHEYAQNLLTDPARQLPAGVRLADFYAANRLILENRATERPLNGVVANRLLPSFEKNPHGWQAVCFLPVTTGTLRDYLREWLAQTPVAHAAIVRAIAQEFGVTL